LTGDKISILNAKISVRESDLDVNIKQTVTPAHKSKLCIQCGCFI